MLFAISLAHLLNDMMQSLLPAIYPTLKTQFHLNFTQIGFVTFTFQLTASLLQPVVGFIGGKRPAPFSLPIGMLFTLVGLMLLAFTPNYWVLLLATALIGTGSSVFHRGWRGWLRAGGRAWRNRCSKSAATLARRWGRWWPRWLC